MIDVLIHAGPSLAPQTRPLLHGWEWRPPAVAGDALRAISLKPRAFVLIDGVFDAVCAIRHKELLELLAEGVQVIGASSMGALRAAELHPFGMEGVGHIFEGYAAGRLTCDDEVALLHGPVELDWLPLTLPFGQHPRDAYPGSPSQADRSTRGALAPESRPRGAFHGAYLGRDAERRCGLVRFLQLLPGRRR